MSQQTQGDPYAAFIE